MRRHALLGVSMLAFGVALSGAGFAADLEQTSRVTHAISGVNGNAFGLPTGKTDNLEVRSELLTGSVFEDAAGIIHAQQINGTGNAVGIAETVGEAFGQGSALQNEIIGVSITGNTVGENGSTENGFIDRSNRIQSNAFNGVDGITDVQQNNGDANSIAIANNILYRSHSTALQQVTSASTTISGNLIDQDDVSRDNTITNAFEGIAGITTVQQNNGDANSLAAGNDFMLNEDVGGPIAQTTSIVSAVTSNGNGGSPVSDTAGERLNTISGSAFVGAQGLVDVQQNNGDANAMTDKKKVVIVNDGLVAQSNNVTHQILDNYTSATGGTRTNQLTGGVLDGFEGLVAIQQNNGNANAMTVSEQVAVNFGDDSASGTADDVGQQVGISATLGGTTAMYGTTTTSDSGNVRNNNINNSFSGVAGIFNIEQNNGDANSMAIAESVGANGPTVPENLGSASQAVNVFATHASFTGAWDTSNGTRTNRVGGSFNGSSTGIVNVQQNNGTANALGIGSAILADVGSGANDGDLEYASQAVTTAGTIGGGGGRLTSNYKTNGGGLDRTNTVTNSFRGFDGIVNLQQNEGDGNILGIANGIVARQGTSDMYDGTFPTSGSPAAVAAATAGNVRTIDEIEYKGDVRNTMTGNAFEGFAGIANVQQSNADFSVFGISNAVTVGNETGDGMLNEPKRVQAAGLAVVNPSHTAKLHGFSSMENRVEGGTFNDADGVVTLQQGNGFGHVVGASFAAFADFDGAGAASFGSAPVVQLAQLDATVANVSVGDTGGGTAGPNSTNVMTGSFQNFAGVAQVQQVNGVGNAVQSAVSVVAAGLPATFAVPGVIGIGAP